MNIEKGKQEQEPNLQEKLQKIIQHLRDYVEGQEDRILGYTEEEGTKYVKEDFSGLIEESKKAGINTVDMEKEGLELIEKALYRDAREYIDKIKPTVREVKRKLRRAENVGVDVSDLENELLLLVTPEKEEE